MHIVYKYKSILRYSLGWFYKERGREERKKEERREGRKKKRREGGKERGKKEGTEGRKDLSIML